MSNDTIISIILVCLIALTAIESYILGMWHGERIAERSSAYLEEAWQSLPRETER